MGVPILLVRPASLWGVFLQSGARLAATESLTGLWTRDSFSGWMSSFVSLSVTILGSSAMSPRARKVVIS